MKRLLAVAIVLGLGALFWVMTAKPQTVSPAEREDVTRKVEVHVVRATWGSTPDQLGREHAQESNPEGPMSLTVDREGAVWILDQANGRIVRRKKGEPPFTLPVPVRAAQDLLVLPSGEIAVLDRLADREVAILSPSGALLTTLPLEGKNLREGGAVTGLFAKGDELYAEREHGPLVHLGSAKGPASDRAEMLGRPSPSGEVLITAGMIDKTQGTVYVTAIDASSNAQRFTVRLGFGAPVDHLEAVLPSDTTIYVAASVRGEANFAFIRIQCLDTKSGAVTGKIEVPESPLADETFRNLSLAEGGVMYAYRDELGATYSLHTCNEREHEPRE